METNAILDGCSHCTAGACCGICSQLWSLPSSSFLTWGPLSQQPQLPYFECHVNKKDITGALPLESWCWVGVDGGELLPTLLFQGCTQPAWAQLKKVMDLKVSAPGILGKGDAPHDSFWAHFHSPPEIAHVLLDLQSALK